MKHKIRSHVSCSSIPGMTQKCEQTLITIISNYIILNHLLNFSIKGCTIPRNDGLNGNTFSYGGRIRLGCTDGYEVFPEIKTCPENGSWVVEQSQLCILSFFKGSYYYLQPLPMNWFKAKVMYQ